MEETNEHSSKTVAFLTLGCKVNQDETEAMEAIFVQNGYQLVNFEETADVYVVNTCTVTHLSDRKSRQMLRRARKNNSQAVVIATGCYAQIAAAEILSLADVDLVVGNNQRTKIVQLAEQFAKDQQKRAVVENSAGFKHFEELPMERMIERTRAYLKVQDGCEQFCTYCIIPYARGPLRSRSLESTLAEAKKLEEAGFKELILTGIHLGAYGQEQPEQQLNITALCRKILQETSIARLRLGSIEPMEVTDELIALIASTHRMCRHLHLPLQSGHDDILAQMHRPYRTDDYRQKLLEIRRSIPDIAISTDLMVGFPGENDDHFRKCLAFCDEMAFSNMHIFKYSPRTGTPAAEYAQQIDAAVKDSRSKRMADVAAKNSTLFMQRFVGQQMLVLCEEQDKYGLWTGHTDNYLKVSFTGEATRGDLVWVSLERIGKKELIGSKIE